MTIVDQVVDQRFNPLKPQSGRTLQNLYRSTSKDPKYANLLKNSKSRPLGYLETYSSVGHDLKIYNGVILSAIFTPTDKNTVLNKTNLYPALKTVILNNPSLAVQIYGQSTESPRFVLAKQMNLDNQACIFAGSNTEEERIKIYEYYLSNNFDNIEITPPWRVLVSPMKSEDNKMDATSDSTTFTNDGESTYANEDSAISYEIAFIFHHSIGDGMSGRVFLTSLCESLNNPDSEVDFITNFSKLPNDNKQKNERNCLLDIPDSMELPKSLEMVLKFPFTPKFLSKNLVKEFGLLKTNKGCWTGPPLPNGYGLNKGSPNQAKIRKIRIPADNMKKIFLESRKRGTTVTCLLAAISLAALSRSIPQEHMIVEGGDCGGLDKYGKPYTKVSIAMARNLRPIIPEGKGIKSDTMGDFVCSHEFTFLRNDLTSMSSVRDAYATRSELDLLWNSAVSLKQRLNKIVDKRNKDLNTGLLRFAGNIHKYYQQKSTRARLHSIDLSCLVAPETSKDEDNLWNVSGLGFVQSISGEGAPFNLSTISFKGEDTVLGFVWSNTNMPEKVMNDVIAAFTGYTDAISCNLE